MFYRYIKARHLISDAEIYAAISMTINTDVANSGKERFLWQEYIFGRGCFIMKMTAAIHPTKNVTAVHIFVIKTSESHKSALYTVMIILHIFIVIWISTEGITVLYFTVSTESSMDIMNAAGILRGLHVESAHSREHATIPKRWDALERFFRARPRKTSPSVSGTIRHVYRQTITI